MTCINYEWSASKPSCDSSITCNLECENCNLFRHDFATKSTKLEYNATLAYQCDCATAVIIAATALAPAARFCHLPPASTRFSTWIRSPVKSLLIDVVGSSRQCGHICCQISSSFSSSLKQPISRSALRVLHSPLPQQVSGLAQTPVQLA